MIGVREFAKRVALPNAAVWVLESKVHSAVRSRLGKLRGRDPRAELFVSLADPYARLALAAMAELSRNLRIDYDVFPIVRDQAGNVQPLRQRYAVLDARRLAARRGIEMSEREPIDPARVEQLTSWVEAARAHNKHRPLLELVVTRLWSGTTLPDFGELYALYRQAVGAVPPKNLLLARHRIRQNEGRMNRRGLWSSSSLWLEGKTFFAHERREQISDYLGELDS